MSLPNLLIPRRLLGPVLLALSLVPATARAQPFDAVWTHLPPASQPGPTSGGWVVYDSRRDRFLHHAGSRVVPGSPRVYPRGVFAIEPDSRTPWSQIANDGNLPQFTSGSAVYDSVADCVWVFGGFTDPDDGFNHLWKFDVGSATWQQVMPGGVAPAPRFEAGLVLDTRRHRLLVFGGRIGPHDQPDLGQVFGDLWELPLDSTLVWRRIDAAGPPDARFTAAMVYDPVRDRVVIVSGGASDSILSDAWTFDAAGETWSALTPGGSGPAGPTRAVIDSENDRMLVFGTGDPVPVLALPLDGTGPWTPLDVARSEGVSWAGNIVPRSIAAAMGRSPRGVLMLWERFDFGVTARDPAFLRFPPLTPLALTIGPAQARYAMKGGSLDWSVTSDRPLYDRVRLRVTSSPVPQPDRGDGFVTASPGTFTILHDAMAPATRYAYRATWFDGVAERDTNFVVDTPPHPIDIGFAFEPFEHRGYDVNVHFSASDDSARMLSTQSLERRIPPGPWETLWADINLPALGTWYEAGVIPDTTYEYRAGWGDPAAGRFATASVRTRPRPQRISYEVTASPLAVHIVWSIRPGSVFQGIVHRYHTGGDSDVEPDGVFPVHADANGLIVVHDTDVRPNQRYAYPLEWDVGGLTIGDYGLELVTPPGSSPPPPPTSRWVAKLNVVNPSRDRIDFTIGVESSPVMARVFDIGGRLRWNKSLTAGDHVFQLAGSGWPAGIYLVRIDQNDWSVTKRVALVR